MTSHTEALGIMVGLHKKGRARLYHQQSTAPLGIARSYTYKDTHVDACIYMCVYIYIYMFMYMHICERDVSNTPSQLWNPGPSAPPSRRPPTKHASKIATTTWAYLGSGHSGFWYPSLPKALHYGIIFKSYRGSLFFLVVGFLEAVGSSADTWGVLGGVGDF